MKHASGSRLVINFNVSVGGRWKFSDLSSAVCWSGTYSTVIVTKFGCDSFSGKERIRFETIFKQLCRLEYLFLTRVRYPKRRVGIPVLSDLIFLYSNCVYCAGRCDSHYHNSCAVHSTTHSWQLFNKSWGQIYKREHAIKFNRVNKWIPIQGYKPVSANHLFVSNLRVYSMYINISFWLAKLGDASPACTLLLEVCKPKHAGHRQNYCSIQSDEWFQSLPSQRRVSVRLQQLKPRISVSLSDLRLTAHTIIIPSTVERVNQLLSD